MGEKEKWTCKHCGSDEGVAFQEKQLYERHVYGYGLDPDAEFLRIIGNWPKEGKCLNCGKYTPIPRAT